jgi:AraC-like DNA-binding protein
VKVPLLLVILFSVLPEAFAQKRDTVLNMVLTKPFFYNVIQGADGKVFAGSSDGIMEIEGASLHKYGSDKGYLTTNTSGKPVIDTNGVRYYKERKYLHLLPYPEVTREEYHAGAGSLFYICSGGRLYMYDIVSYGYSYPNHSFRSISKDFLGTYSGIYLKEKKMGLPAPPFVDGQIRQFGDRAFICNYNLIVLEKDAMESGRLVEGVNYFLYQRKKPQLFKDIFPTPDQRHYLIATETELVRTDRSFSRDTLLFKHNQKATPITFITENPYSLYFTAGEKLYSYFYATGAIALVATLTEPIMGGVYANQEIYLATRKGIFRQRSADHRLEKLTDLPSAHTVTMAGNSELIISSDNGLYSYNVLTRTLSILIKGVEFNRQALFKDGGTIYAGSINGLYTILENNIPALVESNKPVLAGAGLFRGTLLVLIIGVPVLLLLLGITLRGQKKLKAAELTIEALKVPREPVNRQNIEKYLANHLANASIKSLVDEFDISTSQLYDILKPDRPGSIIQQIRLQMVQQMRAEEKNAEEIAEATGFSVSYVKKLKI